MKLLPALMLCLFVLACDDAVEAPAAPTMDGTWHVDSLTCAGQAQQIGDFTLIVNGGTGQFIQAFGPECVVTLTEEYSYPAEASFAISPTAITCDPNTACPPGIDLCMLPPPTEFNFSVTGSSATFTRTAATPADAPCAVGDEMVFVMSAVTP